MSLKAARWMTSRRAPLIVGLRPDAARIAWLRRMPANCTAEACARDRDHMMRLALHSRNAWRRCAETGVAYDERTRGTLRVFRHASQVEAAQKDIAVLRRSGVAFEVLDADG